MAPSLTVFQAKLQPFSPIQCHLKRLAIADPIQGFSVNYLFCLRVTLVSLGLGLSVMGIVQQLAGLAADRL